MSEIPDDIMDVAFALTASDWNQPHEVRAKKVGAAIAAERERCAASLESLVQKRRAENPKRYLGNDYIMSCAAYIRRSIPQPERATE